MIIIGIHAVLIYFALRLLICIMIFKKIIYIMVFMQIDIGIKRGVFHIRNIWKEYKQKIVLGIFRFVNMLF